MCGIVGYIGSKNAVPIVLDGLKKLEYRGYDSAGVAMWDGERIVIKKTAGRVAVLERALAHAAYEGHTAIAHTRWATHGKPVERNAHPHADCNNSIFVVHNGIIENYVELKEVLAREGHMFRSDTDTEILAHLIERSFLQDKKILLEDAVLDALRHVTGTYGIAVLSAFDPHKIVAARRGSPLLIGVGNKEFFVASDPAAVVGNTKKVFYLQDNEIAVVTPSGYSIFNAAKKPIAKDIERIDWSVDDAQKGGFDFFMQKEIFEGPQTFENAIRGRIVDHGLRIKLGGLESVRNRVQNVDRIIIAACGTSYYAGLMGKYYFEKFANIPVSVDHASEFRYREGVINSRTAVIVISQSGETADTLEALREAKKKGALTLGVVNVVGSTIARESDAGVYNHAGPEIGVASTKAFIAQLGVLMLISLFWAQERELFSHSHEKIAREMKALPSKMKIALQNDAFIARLAKKYSLRNNFLFLGRKYNYPLALEGALKLKEISYKHAEGYAAGELKHGPIALIDKGFPVVALATKDSVYEKTLSNIQELCARDAAVIAIASQDDQKIKAIAQDIIAVPQTLEELQPIISVIPLQLFAYHTAALLGLDVDKPRNLAKSVTVE